MTNIKLKVAYTDGRTEERELSPGSYRVGRENADLLLVHGSVSAHHADLVVQPQRVVITDAGSRNGTFDPNGQRLSGAYALLPDRPIRVGAVSLTLLRSAGQAGATRVMAEVPAAFAAAPRTAPAPGAPPRLSRWLELLGICALLLLGFVSLKTCTALVQAVSGH